MNYIGSKLVAACLLLCLVLSVPASSTAQDRPFNVLWWNANPDEGNFKTGRHRKAMATYLDDFEGGRLFSVTYGVHRRGNDLHDALTPVQGAMAPLYDVIVLDTTEVRSRFSQQDLAALRDFYASGHDAIMLDGTLNIRFANYNPPTEFPGVNGSSAGLLVNQVAAIARRGGGILIGSDHDRFQVSANAALSALVPGARFSGVTDPSTDGEFLGRTLLGEVVPVRANDLLQHWQTIPNQGETPVGQFTDVFGRPVTFYPLVVAADKPGGSAMRPYISASFDPGAERTAIDSDLLEFEEEPVLPQLPVLEKKPPLPDNMPTRKGGGA